MVMRLVDVICIIGRMVGSTVWLENHVPLAGTPLLLLPVIWKFLPESLMYLTVKKETERAHVIIQKLSPEQQITAQTEFVLK